MSKLQDLKTDVPTLCGHDALSKNKEDAKECADSTDRPTCTSLKKFSSGRDK